MSGPLAGVRVIDLTSVVMGPFATQILADLGADVVKVEPPEGDVLRHIAPMRSPGMGHIFLHHNRNKRSVVLDLKQPAGRDALLRLARGGDVLIYNVRPQAMRRLRLGYEDVAAVNPRIIYVGAYGYGERGRYAGQPAYDDLIQGMAALPAIFADAGADRPRYVPTAIADRITGLAAVNAVTAALFCRSRTGAGQAVEVPMFETLVHMVLADHMAGRTFEPPIPPFRYERMLAPHRAPYATRDGYVCVLIYNDKHWRSFFRLIGREEMFASDPRFASQEARSRNIGEVYAFVAGEMVKRTSAEWLKLLKDADIPVAPLNSIEDVLGDPHLAESGFFVTAGHPTEGRLRMMAAPGAWSRTQPDPLRPAPRLGEHSVEVLREAGYADAEIAAMAASGVTRTP
ncbi:MAG TPA: CoA transferase [Burkholderiales bacterium]|jgi:crotonobetainyl-CoA:carnitine CoA-transferase CaiB-like acyl-CoA transferase